MSARVLGLAHCPQRCSICSTHGEPDTWKRINWPPRTAIAEHDVELRVALARLPERQRTAVFLRYYADLEYAAIGKVLGIQTGTVSATLNAAHAALRSQLEEVRTSANSTATASTAPFPQGRAPLTGTKCCEAQAQGGNAVDDALSPSLRPCSSSSLARPRPSARCVTSSAPEIRRRVNVTTMPSKARRGALASGSCPRDKGGGLGDWCLSTPTSQPQTHRPPWLPRASMCESPGAGGLSE